jgi:hypothetical protein
MSRAVTNPTPQLLFRALFHALFHTVFRLLFRLLSNTLVRRFLDRSSQVCPPMVLNTRRCTICWKKLFI